MWKLWHRLFGWHYALRTWHYQKPGRFKLDGSKPYWRFVPVDYVMHTEQAVVRVRLAPSGLLLIRVDGKLIQAPPAGPDFIPLTWEGEQPPGRSHQTQGIGGGVKPQCRCRSPISLQAGD